MRSHGFGARIATFMSKVVCEVVAREAHSRSSSPEATTFKREGIGRKVRSRIQLAEATLQQGH